MARKWTVLMMCSVVAVMWTGIAGAAKPVEIPAATKFFYFGNGAGKVPKKVSHSIGILKDYPPPVYYCWFAFHDFAKENKGKSTAIVTVFHASGPDEESPRLGGRISMGSVFDCAVSSRALEAGSLVQFKSTNKSLKGMLFDEFGGQGEIYFGGFNPLGANSATALGRGEATVRPEALEMRPLE